RGACVRTSAIVDQKQMPCGLRPDQLEERLVTGRMQPALHTLMQQTPGEILNGATDLGAFALATGRDGRLVAASGPRVTYRSPRGKARLICKQDKPCAPLGRPYKRRPLVLKPRQALGRVQMLRHKTGLLE